MQSNEGEESRRVERAAASQAGLRCRIANAKERTRKDRMATADGAAVAAAAAAAAVNSRLCVLCLQVLLSFSRFS